MNHNIVFTIIVVLFNSFMVACNSSVDNLNDKKSLGSDSGSENFNVKKEQNIERSKEYYIFKNNSEPLIAPEVDFSKNAPVNQLKLEAISIDFYKIKNEILKSGYIEHKENAPLSKKRYEIEPNSYGINKIFFFGRGDELPEISSTIYSTGENLKSQRKIVIYLGHDYDEVTGRYKKINLDPEVPMIFTNILELNSKNLMDVYEKLLQEHITDIENRVHKYGKFLVTNRIEVSGFWFELNTDQTNNYTAFYIYKSNGVPKVNASD